MKMIIGGKNVNSSDEQVINVLNPGNGEIIDQIPLATEGDIESAISNARAGYKKWSKVPLHLRIEKLRVFHKAFLLEKDIFVELAAKEMGKTKAHALAEIENAATLIEYFCDAARTMTGLTHSTGDHYSNESDLMITVREPHGVVACILPFNFPFELFCHKVVPALLMGNSVVIKPATDTPLCNIKMTQLLLDSGVTPEAVNIVTGSGSKVGAWITKNKNVDAVTFTGSTTVGIEIAKNCAENLTKVALELGGNDSLVILEDADLNHAVDETIGGRAYCSGQVCCANKRILVHNSIKENFVNLLKEKLTNVIAGDQFDEKSFYGPQVSEKAAIEIEDQIKLTIEQGGKLILGGNRFNNAFIEPTIIEVDSNMDVSRDLEIFGPVWPIIGFEDIEEACSISNQSIYGLSGGVITNDLEKGMKISKNMETGCVVINGTGCYRAPGQGFGGYKMSGIGREGGVYTLEEMTQVKTIVFRKMYE